MKSQSKSDDPLGKLVARRSKRPAARGEVCPDAEMLAAYIDGGLAAEEVDRLDAHLAACGACRATLSRLTPAEAEAERPQLAWLHAVPRVDAKWVSLAAMLVVGASLWLAWRGAAMRESPAPSVTMADAKRETPEATPPPAPASPPVAADEEAGSGGAGKLQAEARRLTRRPADASKRTAPPAASDRRQGSNPAPARSALGGNVRKAASTERDRGSRDDLKAEESRPAPPLAEARREAAVASANRERQVAATAPEAPAAAGALSDAVRAKDAAADRNVGQAAAPAAAVAETVVPTAAGVRATAGGVIFMEPERRLWWRIVGASMVESSSDGGVVWNPSLRDRSLRLLAGSAPEVGVVWVAGARGVVMRRVTPLGWTRAAAPTSEDLVSIAASSGSSARVTTRSGQVYETDDGGATWTAR